MTINACYVVAPVLAPLVVVALFFAGMASQAAFGDLLWRFVFKSPNLRLVSAAFNVGLAGSVARFATLPLCLPSGLSKLGVSCAREAVELFLVTTLASLASDVVLGLCRCRLDWFLVLGVSRLRQGARNRP